MRFRLLGAAVLFASTAALAQAPVYDPISSRFFTARSPATV